MMTVKNLDHYYLFCLISLMNGDIADNICEELAKYVEEQYRDGTEFDTLMKLVDNLEVNADGSWFTHS